MMHNSKDSMYAAQCEYDKQGMACEKKAKMDAKAMMSDSRFMHAMHEASESPKYEAMEHEGVKMLKAMRGPKGGY